MESVDPDSLALRLPVDFVVRGTPASIQTSNKRTRDAWIAKVREAARARVAELTDFHFLVERPVSITIYYFPPDAMPGDLDNIVKYTVDGPKRVIYPDDKSVERILIQKFEPGTPRFFRALTPKLAEALDSEPPVLYMRIDGDLLWRILP